MNQDFEFEFKTKINDHISCRYIGTKSYGLIGVKKQDSTCLIKIISMFEIKLELKIDN